MKETIYIDVYFGINWVVDFLILYITEKVFSKKCSHIMRGIAATVGGVWSVVLLCFGVRRVEGVYVMKILGVFLIPYVMIALDFKEKRIDKNILRTVGMIIISSILGGICYGICSFTSIGYVFLNKPICWVYLLYSAALLLLIKNVCREIVEQKGRYKGCIYKMEIRLNGKSIKCKGLADTGNVLKDPYTGKCIHIVKRKVFEPLLREEDGFNNYRLVPFSSIGRKRGMIPVIDVDFLQISNGSQVIYQGSAAIGLGNIEFNNEDFDAIINKAILES